MKEFCRYNGSPVHETIIANGKIGFFKNKIDHFSYRSYDHYISKMNHYGALRGKQFLKKQESKLFHILIKPPQDLLFIIY